MDPIEHLAASADHFRLFGLEPAFALDEAALQSRYLELARLTHPDFAGADAERQLAAMELSARVNEAYRILADPEERANYLLELLGGPGREEDKSLPPNFLEEVISLREELAEAAGEGARSQVKERRGAMLADIARLFSAPSTPEMRHQIRTQLNALRYVQRMMEQL